MEEQSRKMTAHFQFKYEPIKLGIKWLLCVWNSPYYDRTWQTKIMSFVCKIMTSPDSWNSTLQELRSEIWKNKSLLLGKHVPPPSIQWIANRLNHELHWNKQVGTVEPQMRNHPEVILERKEFALWLLNLSEIDRMRLIWEDEHSVNFWTVSKSARSPLGLEQA